MINSYYQIHKEKPQKEAREKNQSKERNLSKEEKHERQKVAWHRYQILSEEQNRNKTVSIIVNVIRIFLRNKGKPNWVY